MEAPQECDGQGSPEWKHFYSACAGGLKTAWASGRAALFPGPGNWELQFLDSCWLKDCPLRGQGERNIISQAPGSFDRDPGAECWRKQAPGSVQGAVQGRRRA